MTRTILSAATALALAAPLSAGAAGTELTLYSGDFDAVSQSEAYPGGPGYALVATRVEFDMASGETTASLGRLPTALDAGSVRLQPKGDAEVRGQRFDFAMAGQDDLLRRAVGRTVTVEQATGDSRQSVTGTLLSAGNGLTLRLPDGRVKVLANYSSFELASLPDGLVTEPTLAWTLAAPRAGRQAFALDYATAGLAWRAEYRADLSGGASACRMDWDGAAMVVNRSGADFDGVALSLVAGQPNRVSGDSPVRYRMAAAQADMAMAPAPAPPVAEASGEYHAYRLPGTASLPQGSVQRLPLMAPARGIVCERRYETGQRTGGWQPRTPMIDPNFTAAGGEQPVTVRLAFDNRKTAGLGIPLPAGRVRVFDGADLLGEASLGHTPANAEVALDLGTVFDLTATRERADFSVDRGGRQMQETIRVTVRNAKPDAATVRIHETLPRWSDWEIVASSVPAKKQDAQVAAFDLRVPAGGEAVLSYTVRYRWAPDVKIP